MSTESPREQPDLDAEQARRPVPPKPAPPKLVPPKLVPPPRRTPPRLSPPAERRPDGARPGSPDSTPRGPEPFLPARGGRSAIGMGTIVGFATLALAAVTVFGLLPGWVGSEGEPSSAIEHAAFDSLAGESAAIDPASPAPSDVGSLADEEAAVELDPEARRRQAAERLQARRVLEGLAGRLELLEEREVEEWGGPAWDRASQLVEDGRLRFEGRDWAGAMETWAEAGDALGDLENRLPQVRDAALGDGDTALAEGRIATAEAAYHLALTLDPSSARAEQGLRRARVWHDVQTLLDDAREHENRGDFAAAQGAYRRALELDGTTPEARQGLARMATRLADNAFARTLSQGFEALEAQRWSAAREAFRSAAKLRTGSASAQQTVADALARVDTEEKVWKIEDLGAEGRRLEKGEDWRGAAASYAAVLELDGAVAFALEGKERANARAELAERMKSHLDTPDRLGEATVLEEVDRLLARARAVEPAGPIHQSRIARLEALFDDYSKPRAVSLRSDGATQVIVYRVGKLGTFQQRDLELRPGRYTVVGTRDGYRDVRLELVVSTDGPTPPLDIRCTEAI